MTKKKRPGRSERLASKRAAQLRRDIVARNLSSELGDTPRKTDIRTATTQLVKADSYGWDYDSRGNVRNVSILVNPVSTKS